MRCQFCGVWSTAPSPFTHSKASACRFWPLISWYQGVRDHPKGFICSPCVNATSLWFRSSVQFLGAQWRRLEVDVGNLKCAAYFKANPTKLHACLGGMRRSLMLCRRLQQREKLIEMKNDNPALRLRGTEMLGPRTCLDSDFE